MARPANQVCTRKEHWGHEVATLVKLKGIDHQWELLNPVDACGVIEMLTLNAPVFLSMLDVREYSTLASTNWNVGECLMWVALFNSRLDMVSKLPTLKTLNRSRLLEREIRRQEHLAFFKRSKICQ